ncbi:MAG: chromosome segregation protein SMC [Nitrosopumilaceae archaeon]|nr:chromosome segregation protein SMC [Nitrosopumilaceae archaeon]
MVHIEKVEIYGFKSFGFRNTTVKLAPGLVSISGPNGSGKSTILDAIAFALGEKSPTILRVDTLKSVINDVEGSRAGTRVARVSIHLDNRDRSIPVDDDRVEITRVMGGTGESAYYINKRKGTRGRIRDVLEVANAGLGRLNHVQQGTVTRISEFSAEEKRGAIEDLVGLSYFDEKKEQASRQLEQADGRLEVALAKMGDVRTRIVEMEEERNHMVRQGILERDLARYETMQRLRELAVLRRKMGDLESRIGGSYAEMKKNAAELEAVRREMESVEAKKRDILAEASTHDAERTRIEGEIDRTYTKSQNAESELRAAEGRASRAEARLADIRAELADIAVSRAQNRRSASGLRARLEEAQVQAGRATEALGSINERRREVLGRQSEAAARRARSENTLRLFRNTLAGHERRLMEVQTWMESAARQASSDRRRLGDLEAGLAESDVNERRLASWIDRHTRLADSAAGRIARLEDECTRLSSEADEMDGLIRRAGQAAARYDSKLRLVRKVMHEDYSIGRLRNDAPGLGVLGLAYELLSWPENVDRAVMAAGSDWLKALVVEDMEAMAAISEAAVSMGLPRLRIIPLRSIPTTRPPTGRLSGHISCSSGFEPLREFIFGETVLAESEGSARRHAAAGLRAVTRSGLCVEPGRAATLDLGSRISNLTKIISMSAEIGGLQNSVSLLERMRAHHSTRLRDADAEMRLKSKTLAGLRADLAAAAQTLADAESRSSATRSTLKSLRARLAAYDSDLPQMESRRRILDRLVARVKSLISAEDARMPTDSDEIASSLELLNRKKAEFEQLQTQTNTELTRMRAEWSGAVSNGERLLRRASKLASEQLSAVAERRDALSSVPLFRDTLGAARNNLAALRQTQQQMMETSSQSVSRQRSCDSTFAGLRKQERALAGGVSQMQRRHDSLERDLADCRAATSRIAESLPTRPDPDLPLDTDPVPFITALKHEMESLPPLNANAPATYARVTSEYRSMSERKNSLEQERNRIVAFIEDVDRDKRQAYLDAFDIVDKEIRSIFDRMSGGSAWLELEDEDDVFGSGIRYMVQFPGKSKRTSASISGGEKTLAAVVFVLALQKLKPSPFYLFDEVDAHLDAPNSEKLAGILEERARDNQFIMVSLKESVVQKAGLIYGVYPKKGLTQVVSYRDRRLRPAAR